MASMISPLTTRSRTSCTAFLSLAAATFTAPPLGERAAICLSAFYHDRPFGATLAQRSYLYCYYHSKGDALPCAALQLNRASRSGRKVGARDTGCGWACAFSSPNTALKVRLHSPAWRPTSRLC